MINHVNNISCTRGTLFLIPSLLGEESLGSLTPYLVDTINNIDEYIVENVKSARKFLKEAGCLIAQKKLIFHNYGKHIDKKDARSYIKSILDGKNLGLLSDAGCPAIADPGSEIVALCHKEQINIKPLVGPNSIILALMASGFNGQSFSFHGYLPINRIEKIKKIKNLEDLSYRFNQSQIFIETPFRNNQMIEDIVENCRNETLLCLACDITAKSEFIKTKTIDLWKKQKPDLHKRPAVFIIYRNT